MYSHNEEEEVLARLLPGETGTCVDIGAGDGIIWSNSRHFVERGWNCLLIDPDPVKFSALASNCLDFPKCSLARLRVTPDNVKSLFQLVNPNFDLLSLDIDGYDLHVLREILKTHKPQVICMEYNPHFPPGIKFSVKYSPDYWWGVDGFFGCSIEAAVETLVPFGYGVEAVVMDNVIFNLGSTNAGWERKWEDGFLNKPPEMLEFYNSMSKYFMAITDPEERFSKACSFFPVYEGKYDVWK